MLNFVIKDKNQNDIKADLPTEVIINSSTDIAADDITVVFLYSKKYGDGDFVFVYDDERLVFKGQIDEIKNILNSGSFSTKITARSMAAFLLDNEAEPVTYSNPSADFIFDRHIKPFGFTQYKADTVPFYGPFKIEKGMTHWQVLEKFCKKKYGASPRICGDSTVLFTGCNSDKTLVFSDMKDNGDFCILSVVENTKRCSVISDVRLKLVQSKGYESIVKNEDICAENILRRRYVDAASSSDCVAIADRIIEQGNKKSYGVTLECPMCCVEALGKKAEVMCGRLEIQKNMVVYETKYVLNANGEKTTVYLRRGT